MISNCGHDENGNIHSGKAGDQTGGEWTIINWYNRPWKCILRHPDENVRKKIAEYATSAAKNDHVGYDQWQRTTFYDQLKNSNWDPSKIDTDCEADCSSGVTAIAIAVGHALNINELANLDPKLYTGNMRKAFTNAGFKVYTANKYLSSDKYLLEGDILLNDDKHTAVNLNDGSETVKTAPVSNATKSVSEIVDEVIAGKWGNDPERKAKLEAAGYNAQEIQNEVNKKLNVSTKSSTPTTTYSVVNVNTRLRVRSGPGTSYSIVDYLNNGDKFTITGTVETKNGFTKIAADKWVSNNYIKRM